MVIVLMLYLLLLSLLETVSKMYTKYCGVIVPFILLADHHHHTTTVLRPFFRDHLGEPVPEENFWTLWYMGRLTEADTPTIWLGTTPSGLTSAHFRHPPCFFYRPDALPAPNQQCQSTEGN